MSEDLKQEEMSLWYDEKDNLSVTTEEFDSQVEKMLLLEEVREAKKNTYKEADEAYERQRSHVLALLQRTNKTKYHIDGIGTVSRAVKYSVNMPKDPDEKKLVLDYFKSLGDDVFSNTVSIYYASLNSYFNQQRENDPEFKIPGLAEPQRTEELRFRRG